MKAPEYSLLFNKIPSDDDVDDSIDENDSTDKILQRKEYNFYTRIYPPLIHKDSNDNFDDIAYHASIETTDEELIQAIEYHQQERYISLIRISLLFLFFCLIIRAAILLYHEEERSEFLIGNSGNTDGYVILFGDSLIARSITRYGLLDYISSKLPFTLSYFNKGVSSNQVKDLNERLTQDVINVFPPAASNISVLVLLLWDTDICGNELDYESKTSQERQQIRRLYAGNVTYLLSRLVSYGVTVALAGPTLCSNHESTEEGLDAYRVINHDICNLYGVNYMDIRSAYKTYELSGFIATEDGEHPNHIGTMIIGDYFAGEILSWQTGLQTRKNDTFH